MKPQILLAFLILFFLGEVSIANAKDVVFKEKCFIVDKSVDLNGDVIILPQSSILQFKSSGKIYNGKIIGNGTSIKGAQVNSIGTVLEGTWAQTNILDIWFNSEFLSDNDIIDNIITLQNDGIKQEIIIQRDYLIEFKGTRSIGLSLSSNTKLKLHSTLSVKPNRLAGYSIIDISNKVNVTIDGGLVKGDVGSHNYVDGTTSEWGFGVHVSNSENIIIENTEMSFCIGDGVYVGGIAESTEGDYAHASRKITIKNCKFDSNRREAISLVHAENVVIDGCAVYNMGQVEYTPPSFGINIEPNKKQSVRNVLIRRFKTFNSKPDISFSSSAYRFENGRSNRGNIVLEECSFDKGVAIKSGDVRLVKCDMKKVVIYTTNMIDDNVIFDNCIISGGDGIRFDGQTTLDMSLPLPYYCFRNCSISANSIFRTKPGLIWSLAADKINAKLRFEKCDISLLPSLGKNNVISDGFNIDCCFDACKIDSKEYAFAPKGLTFKKCSIKCQYIDGSTINKKGLLENCKIETTHPNTRILNADGVIIK